jgi:hypothetical protein
MFFDEDLIRGNEALIILSQISINLRTLIIDYCDVDMACFETVWNNCRNLSFLGLAGLCNDENDLKLELLHNDNLTILRFVDCQINDDIVFILF